MKQPENGVRITLVPTPWEGPGESTNVVRCAHAAPPADWACRR
jgi:hypothetical protein